MVCAQREEPLVLSGLYSRGGKEEAKRKGRRSCDVLFALCLS